MQETGTKVDPEAMPGGSSMEGRTWFKRDPDAPVTDDGACFIVSEDEAPDASKQWFFCSDPSDDENMACELVPEWMSSACRHGQKWTLTPTLALTSTDTVTASLS